MIQEQVRSLTGMIYATNPDRRLVALTDDRGFTVLFVDSGPAEIGDTLTSGDDGLSWFNVTRRVRLVAYSRAQGVRPSDLRRHLFPSYAACGQMP